MKCIGQSKFRASSEYVHLQCTHQPTHESSLRSLQVIAAQFISIALLGGMRAIGISAFMPAIPVVTISISADHVSTQFIVADIVGG